VTDECKTLVFVHRVVCRWRCRAQNAALLSVWRHREYRKSNGVNGIRSVLSLVSLQVQVYVRLKFIFLN